VRVAIRARSDRSRPVIGRASISEVGNVRPSVLRPGSTNGTRASTSTCSAIAPTQRIVLISTC
jgi:hypothetical protein